MAAGVSEIVLIDDSPHDVFFAKRLMAQAGTALPITAFNSPATAVKYLLDLTHNQRRPSVCFVDLRMPEINGFEVLQWIRAHSALDDVPVVTLSDSDALPDRQHARQLGADCYLKKFPSPLEMQAVLACATAGKKVNASPGAGFSLPVNLLSGL